MHGGLELARGEAGEAVKVEQKVEAWTRMLAAGIVGSTRCGIYLEVGLTSGLDVRVRKES